ncbi:MAG: isocitrate lyase/phosphoenolpyruvate mutase family protein [Bacteroidota bacterium]
MPSSDLALSFRRLHTGAPLVLPNAWDAGSARMIEDAGAAAIATTSAGVAWSRGRRDGHGLSATEAADAVRRIAETVAVPVSADIEGGYGAGTPEDVAASVRLVVEAGAVGINLEDASGAGLFAPDEQAARIQAARAAADDLGVGVFINARTDVYLAGIGAEADRLAHVADRAAAYLDAGADGIFVPGVSDSETICALVEAIDAPLNVMAGPGALSVSDLAALGVVRISLGPSVALAALDLARAAAREALTLGTYASCDLGFGEANALFADV